MPAMALAPRLLFASVLLVVPTLGSPNNSEQPFPSPMNRLPSRVSHPGNFYVCV